MQGVATVRCCAKGFLVKFDTLSQMTTILCVCSVLGEFDFSTHRRQILTAMTAE